MNKKYIIDFIMTILIILLMRIVFLNNNLHELIGVITFVLFIIHKLFNYKIIANTIKNWKTSNSKIKIGFILDILLLLVFILLFISSLIISNKIFVFLNIKSSILWSDIHHFSSYLMFILISIHLGFHFKTILIVLENKLKIKNTIFKKYTYILISILLIIFGIKTIFNNNFYKYLLKPFGYKETNNIIQEDVSTDKITLDEYLKDKHCDGCSRHCPLTNLRCSNGQQYLQKAIEDYNNLYTVTKDNIKINVELNVLDYFIVMSSIVATTHYILKVKKIK